MDTHKHKHTHTQTHFQARQYTWEAGAICSTVQLTVNDMRKFGNPFINEYTDLKYG
jgi:hypothetical protein